MSDERETKEIYNDFKGKHNLPDYEKLHRFLELTDLDDNDLVLVTIKNKIKDRICKLTDILETMVQPDASTNSMYESRFISDEDRMKAFDIYKKLMVFKREADLLMLDEKDEDLAKFINDFFGALDDIKEKISQLITKQKESWEKNSETKEDFMGYFG